MENFQDAQAYADPTSIYWDKTEKGGLRATFNNAVNCLNTLEDLKGLFRFNCFTWSDEIVRKTSWDINEKYPKPVNDRDIIGLKTYISNIKRIEFTKNILDEAIMSVAMKNQYHPVKEYLQSLKWDGVKRVDCWLSSYLGTEYNEYTKFIGKITLVAAIKRIFEPGCKYDHMLILEGEQGIGKSETFKILAGDWFSEISLMDRDKDTVDKMLGIWILEVAELEVFKKADINSLKAFITISKDKTRLAYNRRSEFFKRQSIFVGTINREEDNGYLRDTTGNRRFFPVEVTNVDFKKLKEDRDQLWAESYTIYREGFKTYISDKNMNNLIKEHQESRVEIDVWQEKIEDWLENASFIDKEKIKVIDIWERCLQMQSGKIKQQDRRRISKSLKNLGYVNKVFKENGKTIRYYFLEKNEENESHSGVDWE